MPESGKDLDARSMPRVLADNLLVESTSGLTEDEVRSAVNTWLRVEDDEEVLRAEVELEIEEVTENISKVRVEDVVYSEEEGDDGKQESCMKSTISEAEVRSRLEDVRSYLYANGRDGEYSETAYLLSKTVHSFTHETQIKRRAKEGGEVQATLRDMWASCFLLGTCTLDARVRCLFVFCLSWVKSRLAKLSIICFVFDSFLPLGRSGIRFFGVLSRFLRLVLSLLPTFY